MTVYVGVDPSFTGTGVCVLTSDEVKIRRIGLKLGPKNFDNVYGKALEVSGVLKEFVEEHAPFHLIMEAPLINVGFSTGIYCLATLMRYRLRDLCSEVTTYNPSTLRKIHGCKYTKKDSVSLAMSVLRMYYQSYSVPEKISHDCAEAFLYIDHHIRGKELM